jgi:hypothetical protein
MTPEEARQRGGSSPEVFAASPQENKRDGCRPYVDRWSRCGERVPLGTDGSRLYVAQQEFVGAVTGTRYNNVGIKPDVPADAASAVAAATAILFEKIRVGSP